MVNLAPVLPLTCNPRSWPPSISRRLRLPLRLVFSVDAQDFFNCTSGVSAWLGCQNDRNYPIGTSVAQSSDADIVQPIAEANGPGERAPIVIRHEEEGAIRGVQINREIFDKPLP